MQGVDPLSVEPSLGAVRKPITTLWLRLGITTGAPQSLPADCAGGTDAEALRRLPAGQAIINGSQNTRPEIEMR